MILPKAMLLGTLSSATITTAIVETVPAPTWTPEGTVLVVTAFFGGLTLLLTQLYNIYLTHRTRTEVKKDVREVYGVVDGGNTALLAEIADLKQQLADSTGRPSDQRIADTAATRVIEKEKVVETAAAKKVE